MGDRQISKKVKMKLFAVLAFAVAARQVDKYDNDVEIGGPCTHDGALCGLENTECNAQKKCACKADFVPAENNIDCKAAEPDEEVIVDLDVVCTEEDTCGENAACVEDASAGFRALMCKCKPSFNADGKTNCKAEGPALGDVCVVEDANCGGNQECKKSAADASKMTCQCVETHEPKEGKCEPLTTDGSAAFYRV